MLALVLVFALATPGIYLLPALGGLGPTEEGMRLGFEHLLRLLLVLSSFGGVAARSPAWKGSCRHCMA
jgi:hypothetical protein